MDKKIALLVSAALLLFSCEKKDDICECREYVSERIYYSENTHIKITDEQMESVDWSVPKLINDEVYSYDCNDNGAITKTGDTAEGQAFVSPFRMQIKQYIKCF